MIYVKMLLQSKVDYIKKEIGWAQNSITHNEEIIIKDKIEIEKMNVCLAELEEAIGKL